MAAAKTVKGPKSDKLLRDALLVAINREEEFEGQRMKRFARIAEQLAKTACTGDLQATREVWDRVEGKPSQSVAVGQDPDLPALVVEIVRLNED